MESRYVPDIEGVNGYVPNYEPSHDETRYAKKVQAEQLKEML